MHTEETFHNPMSAYAMTAALSSRGRQRLACQECRRRKLRCDGKQPRCSTCEQSGAQCDVNTDRPPRGPKKGYLKALQSKIDTLESRLHAQEQSQLKWPDSLDHGDGSFPAITMPLVTMAGGETGGPDAGLLGMPEHDPFLSTFMDMTSVHTAPSLISDHTSLSSLAGTSCTSFHVTDAMQAELDQLYFDRIHTAVPILHQRRYLSWSRSPTKSKSQTCLQYAVWIAASLMSVQFQHLQEVLYTEVRRLLAGISLPNCAGQKLDADVELVQAWVLVSTYEFAKTYRHEASTSAGRAFRLAQLMGLHKVDAPLRCPEDVDEGDLVAIEEKRRVFWMSFTIETLYSMRNSLPLAINEQPITTLLPLPDHEFQNGQFRRTRMVSESLVSRNQDIRSSQNECILLLAMCTRTLFHAQKFTKQIEKVESEEDSPVWCKWLDDTLALRLQVLAHDYPSPTSSSDPTLLFANFLAQSSIIYLWREMREIEAAAGPDAECPVVAEYQRRSFVAVERMVELTRSLTTFPSFKINPFLPIPLFLCAEFLSLNRPSRQAEALIQNLLEVVRQLKSMEAYQQGYFGLADLDRIIEALHV